MGTDSKKAAEVKALFFIVGPTAVGKSELAADVAARIGAEIVSADAFQVYAELRSLTSRPGPALLKKTRHHLIGEVSVTEEMNVERFRQMALDRIEEIHARGRRVIVAGGSGLYIKALTHGISSLPKSDPELRRQLNEMGLPELLQRLREHDAVAAARIDRKNPRRVVRALEIAMLSPGASFAARDTWSAKDSEGLNRADGIFLERDREELKTRINRRVEEMFKEGAVEEVQRIGSKAGMTAAGTLGFTTIGQLLEGRMTREECVRAIQAATRQYAKRQLTWFRHQSNFESLNLSSLNHAEAVDRVAERALSFY